MINLEACAHSVRDALDECHEHLSPLAAGEIHIGERVNDGDRLDITVETIDQHRKTIVTYEGV